MTKLKFLLQFSSVYIFKIIKFEFHMDNNDMEFIPPPNTLTDMVSTDGSGGINKAVLKHAEAAIENMSDEVFRMGEIMHCTH